MLGIDAASASDMPVKAVYKADPVVAFSWTGFYVGGNAGYGYGQRTGDRAAVSTGFVPTLPFDIPPATVDLRPQGVVGGGQVGFNWQSGIVVWGVEADIQGSNILDSRSVSRAGIGGVANPSVTSASERLDWFGTVRGRLGIAWNQLLLYGTGGFAYGGVRDNASVVFTPSSFFTGSSSGTRGGWAAGAGVEWAFTPSISLKAEYLHVDLGGKTVRVLDAAFPTQFIDYAFQAREDIIRVGINFKFGGGPLVARY